MLYQIPDTDEMEGKTIKTVRYTFNDEILMVFKDGTFICFCCEDGYADESLIYLKEIDMLEFEDIKALIDTGIITRDEYDAKVKGKKAKKARSIEKKEQKILFEIEI